MANKYFAMFWGRTDVYAKRGKNGGYFPQCDNRWNDRLCPKQKELVNKAEDYRIAKEIREYIQAMIESENEDITPEWIEWAKKKADWYDPSVATEDEYLGKRQHEKSAEEKEKSLQDSIRKSWYGQERMVIIKWLVVR